MWRVRFMAYCGMSGIPETFDTKEEARAEIAKRIRYARRKKRPVSILTPGEKWEFETPDDAGMVADHEGTLSLHHVTFKCRECGFDHEDKETARKCCTEEQYSYFCGECGGGHFTSEEADECCTTVEVGASEEDE